MVVVNPHRSHSSCPRAPKTTGSQLSLPRRWLPLQRLLVAQADCWTSGHHARLRGEKQRYKGGLQLLLLKAAAWKGGMHLLTSHWPKFTALTTLSCKGGWEV